MDKKQQSSNKKPYSSKQPQQDSGDQLMRAMQQESYKKIKNQIKIKAQQLSKDQNPIIPNIQQNKPKLQNKQQKSTNTIDVKIKIQAEQQHKSKQFLLTNNQNKQKNQQQKQTKIQNQKIFQITKKLHQDSQLFSNKYRIKLIGDDLSKNPNKIYQDQTISIMSWNVLKQSQYINPSNMHNRYQQIIKIIRQKNPDIVCLQQPQAFRQTYLMPFLRFHGQHYYFSQASKYSTIILSKSPAIFYEINFHQDMQVKPMAMCHFNILCSDKKIRSVIVHSIHLKSRIKKVTNETRAFQLCVLQRINKKYDISIMAGDYNFDDGHQDNNEVKYKYLDLQLHKNKSLQIQQQQASIPNNLNNKMSVQNNTYLVQEIVRQQIHQEQYYLFQPLSSYDGYSDDQFDSQGNPYDSSNQDPFNQHSDQFHNTQNSNMNSQNQNQEEDQDQHDSNEDQQDQEEDQDQQDQSSQQQNDIQSSDLSEQDQSDYQSQPSQSDDNQWPSNSDDNDKYRQNYNRQRQRQRSRQIRYQRNQNRQMQRRRKQRQRHRKQIQRQRRREQKRRQKRQRRQRLVMIKKQKHTIKQNKKITKNQNQHKPERKQPEIKHKNSKGKAPQKVNRVQSQMPPDNQIPQDSLNNIWTYMYYQKKQLTRFDRILMSCKGLSKNDLKIKANVIIFQRIGNKSIGRYQGQKFMKYLWDKIVRTPSDHLGIYSKLWLTF